MRLKITFKSPFMPEDTLVLDGEDLNDIKEKYLHWWKGYGKEGKVAMAAII